MPPERDNPGNGLGAGQGDAQGDGKYTSESQQRGFAVLLGLFADPINGVPPGALAKEAGCTPSQVTRTLDNLATAGLAERVEGSALWRLKPLLPQKAMQMWMAIDRAQARIDQTRQRFAVHRD